MPKRATREVVVFPYTVAGRAYFTEDDIELDVDFSARVEVDEVEFDKAKSNKRMRHWRMEAPSDLAVYKVEKLLDKLLERFDDVEITDCEGDETRKKTVCGGKND